jgi:hypothetical protein
MLGQQPIQNIVFKSRSNTKNEYLRCSWAGKTGNKIRLLNISVRHSYGWQQRYPDVDHNVPAFHSTPWAPHTKVIPLWLTLCTAMCGTPGVDILDTPGVGLPAPEVQYKNAGNNDSLLHKYRAIQRFKLNIRYALLQFNFSSIFTSCQ